MLVCTVNRHGQRRSRVAKRAERHRITAEQEDLTRGAGTVVRNRQRIGRCADAKNCARYCRERMRDKPGMLTLLDVGNIGGQALRLSMTLATGADGNATASLVSPDQSNAAFNASTVTASGSDLTIELRVIGATYKGTVAADTITGSWSQGPVSAPLNFKKAP